MCREETKNRNLGCDVARSALECVCFSTALKGVARNSSSATHSTLRVVPKTRTINSRAKAALKRAHSKALRAPKKEKKTKYDLATCIFFWAQPFSWVARPTGPGAEGTRNCSLVARSDKTVRSGRGFLSLRDPARWAGPPTRSRNVHLFLPASLDLLRSPADRNVYPHTKPKPHPFSWCFRACFVKLRCSIRPNVVKANKHGAEPKPKTIRGDSCAS